MREPRSGELLLSLLVWAVAFGVALWALSEVVRYV